MEFPVVAALVAGTLIVLQQVLMLNTGFHRANVRIGVGFGQDLNLERKIRRHGNLAENAAIFIVVLALAEMATPGSAVVKALGMIFVVARILHGIAFSSLAGSHVADGSSKFHTTARFFGALGSAFSGIAIGAYLIYLVLLAS